MSKIFYVLFGKYLKHKLDLEEGPMEDKKKWYRSKGVWTGIVTSLIGFYVTLDQSLAPALGMDFPNIPEWIFVVLGALGVYSRKVAETKIS